MAETCAVVLQACALRVARLEADGVPLPGANNLYVSDGMVSLTYTENLQKGADLVQKNACGNIYSAYRGPDLLKWVDLVLEVAPYDHQLFELIRGGSVLTSGAAVGYAAPAIGIDPQPNGVSLEVWCKRQIGDAPDPTWPYEWFVFPRCKFAFGQRKIEDGFMVNAFDGFGIENSNWYNGPNNDWPVASTKCYQSLPTATIPTAHCGYQTLSAS